MEKFKNWMTETASVLFDSDANDFRALPKVVRMQAMVLMSFLWSLCFSLYFFNLTTFAFGFVGVFVGHVFLIFMTYYTFKMFHKAKKGEQTGVKEKKELNPAKIFSIIFIIFFMFIFTKGIDVMNKSNSYSIPYDGPASSVIDRIKRFVD